MRPLPLVLLVMGCEPVSASSVRRPVAPEAAAIAPTARERLDLDALAAGLPATPDTVFRVPAARGDWLGWSPPTALVFSTGRWATFAPEVPTVLWDPVLGPVRWLPPPDTCDEGDYGCERGPIAVTPDGAWVVTQTGAQRLDPDVEVGFRIEPLPSDNQTSLIWSDATAGFGGWPGLPFGPTATTGERPAFWLEDDPPPRTITTPDGTLVIEAYELGVDLSDACGRPLTPRWSGVPRSVALGPSGELAAFLGHRDFRGPVTLSTWSPDGEPLASWTTDAYRSPSWEGDDLCGVDLENVRLCFDPRTGREVGRSPAGPRRRPTGRWPPAAEAYLDRFVTPETLVARGDRWVSIEPDGWLVVHRGSPPTAP